MTKNATLSLGFFCKIYVVISISNKYYSLIVIYHMSYRKSASLAVRIEMNNYKFTSFFDHESVSLVVIVLTLLIFFFFFFFFPTPFVLCASCLQWFSIPFVHIMSTIELKQLRSTQIDSNRLKSIQIDSNRLKSTQIDSN